MSCNQDDDFQEYMDSLEQKSKTTQVIKKRNRSYKEIKKALDEKIHIEYPKKDLADKMIKEKIKGIKKLYTAIQRLQEHVPYTIYFFTVDGKFKAFKINK